MRHTPKSIPSTSSHSVKTRYPDLHEYHLIGVATGIYYSEIDKDMARVLTNVLQPQDKVFGLMTYGGKNKWYGKDIDGICRMRGRPSLWCLRLPRL